MLRSLIKKALSVTLLSPASTRVVFTFHDISDSGSPQYSPAYSTEIEYFREQISFIKKKFSVVSLAEIVSGESSEKKRMAAITFDDGFFSVKENALPILQTHSIPFTVFLNQAAIEENQLTYTDEYAYLNKKFSSQVYLNSRDVEEMARLPGVEFANHGKTHRIFSSCSSTELESEILGNKIFLEQLTGKPVRFIAIPYGKKRHYSAEVLNFCFEKAQSIPFSTNPTIFSATDFRRERSAVPRISILAERPEDIIFLVNQSIFRRLDL